MEIYRDQGVSGAKSGKDRPAFEAMRMDAAEGEVRCDRRVVTGWAAAPTPGRVPVQHPRPQGGSLPPHAGSGHHHASREGPLRDQSGVFPESSGQ